MTSSEQFEGTIGRTFRDSELWWPPLPTAPQDRPNVLIILFDDMGFAHLNCYGSTIATPNINRLAANGLRFCNFHVTPLCSPTRASLLTGRNHHTVGLRAVTQFDSGFPHMRGRISHNAATIAELLRDEHYATFAVGKWHLAPVASMGQAGPFHDWPLQRGFDRYYGFLSGETDQFYPELVYDNYLIEPPRSPEDGYHLTEDLVEHAEGFLRDHQSIYPGQPFFSTSRWARRTRLTRCRRSTSRSTAARSTPVGTPFARSGSSASSNSRSFPREPSWLRVIVASRRGTTCHPTRRSSHWHCKRRSPDSSNTPMRNSDSSSITWRVQDNSTTP